MANKDGLEPSQPIDFETLQRVKRQQRDAAKAPPAVKAAAPAPANRKPADKRNKNSAIEGE